MLRRRTRKPRRPRVYRIPLEFYLIALAAAFAFSVAISLLNRPREVVYDIPHAFGVRDPSFLPSAQALDRPSMTAGNRVTILENGVQILPAMLAAIRGAEKSVDFESYIFWSDSVGRTFRDALAESARHGVEIRLLFDGVGTAKRLTREDVEILKSAGARVEYFRPIRPWMLDVINRRSHRRILVVDGKVGFTGGVGIAEEWAGNADSPDHWRDTVVRLEGPAVAQMQSAFEENWSEVTGELLVGEKFFPRLVPAGSVLAAVVPSSPRPSSSANQTLYSVAIAAAEHTISISTSYFVPNDATVALLAAASRRGVDVRVLVPGAINDVPVTKAGGRSKFGDLLRAGVKIFEYQPAMMHAKTMVVDGIFATVGSTNFDNRSFRYNDEIDLAVYDEQIAGRLQAMFEADLGRSRAYTYDQWIHRPALKRFIELVLEPVRPQL
ncbi:MAG TPA: phospholipase D-like domain-containing protein [Thermoanaerobaculia bacterium]|nr:phospholipase D-like domain-containing protein [Thermoanaerobaculia bacterium]